MQTADRTKNVPRPKKNSDRDRIEFRADPEWIAMVNDQAKAWGVNLSAFIRQAVNKWVQENPAPSAKKPRP